MLDPIALETARQLQATWAHLPDGERVDQIEAHMESQGFDQDEIREAIDVIDGALCDNPACPCAR